MPVTLTSVKQLYYAIKTRRFCWRLIRNLICTNPFTRSLLFPKNKLAEAFGPETAEYSWHVFFRHYHRLCQGGFCGGAAQRILEVGPGQNIGSGLIWWALAQSSVANKAAVHVCLWDIYSNTNINNAKLRQWARSLQISSEGYLNHPATRSILDQLDNVAIGKVIPQITYQICSLKQLLNTYRANPFDLVYSQAALEHAWNISQTWETLAIITRKGGWHSHRIDLADHGSRESNYIEMLEWSDLSYWISMRFIPGAINRWRACEHLEFIEKLSFEVLLKDRDIRENFPVPITRLSKKYREMNMIELKTTGLDLVARRL